MANKLQDRISCFFYFNSRLIDQTQFELLFYVLFNRCRYPKPLIDTEGGCIFLKKRKLNIFSGHKICCPLWCYKELNVTQSLILDLLAPVCCWSSTPTLPLARFRNVYRFVCRHSWCCDIQMFLFQHQQKGISPRMLKALVSRGHPEFSSNRQQDAHEFFLHIINLVEVSKSN